MALPGSCGSWRSAALLRTGLAPGGAVMLRPVHQRRFKSHIVTGLFAEDPFVPEDFIPFSEVVGVGSAAGAAGGFIFRGGSRASHACRYAPTRPGVNFIQRSLCLPAAGEECPPEPFLQGRAGCCPGLSEGRETVLPPSPDPPG